MISACSCSKVSWLYRPLKDRPPQVLNTNTQQRFLPDNQQVVTQHWHSKQSCHTNKPNAGASPDFNFHQSRLHHDRFPPLRFESVSWVTTAESQCGSKTPQSGPSGPTAATHFQPFPQWKLNQSGLVFGLMCCFCARATKWRLKRWWEQLHSLMFIKETLNEQHFNCLWKLLCRRDGQRNVLWFVPNWCQTTSKQ